MIVSGAELWEKLRLLEDEIGAWNPAEIGAHAEFVSCLQRLLEHLPDTTEDLRGLLTLAFEAMQRIARLPLAQRRALVEPILSALSAAKQYVLAAHNPHRYLPVQAATRQMLCALQRDGEETPHPAVDKRFVSDPTQDLSFPQATGPDDPVTGQSGSPAVETRPFVPVPEHADRGLMTDFVTEARENIEKAEAALLDLELDSEDMDAVNTVFRAFHTVKGTAAFLGLHPISEMAHAAESLMSRVRDGEIRCAGGYADLALSAVDMLKALVHAVQDGLAGTIPEPPVGYSELLRRLADPESAGISAADLAVPVSRLGDLLVAEGTAAREDVEAAGARQAELPVGPALAPSESASVPDVAGALCTQRRIVDTENAGESSIRVATDRLDRLIDMMGELVIAHSMVAQDEIVVEGGHPELQTKITHAGKIIRELRHLSLSMRMVPLKPMFEKMSRVVRDVAHRSHKRVTFITAEEDTEVDRNVVAMIADPLVHMVRNAVDHGIEPPAERVQNHKTPEGKIRLSAYHSGGTVVVELQDDGRGLDRGRIIEHARSTGLIESADGLSDHDVFRLIFAPGFSTADQVTDVSGRGVGLDVVRRQIEALGGRIEITSQRGKGTMFSVHLPLTLAITDGMLVQVGGERYIIPIVGIYVSFRPQREDLYAIDGRGEMVMCRRELIPLVRLHELFDIPDAIPDPTRGLIVVITDGQRRFGLLVDEILGQQQVVVKSLGAGIGAVPAIAGATILGDGRVGLILDASGMAALAAQTPTPPPTRHRLQDIGENIRLDKRTPHVQDDSSPRSASGYRYSENLPEFLRGGE